LEECQANKLSRKVLLYVGKTFCKHFDLREGLTTLCRVETHDQNGHQHMALVHWLALIPSRVTIPYIQHLALKLNEVHFFCKPSIFNPTSQTPI